METAPLKRFATWARTELITQVNARIIAVLAPASSERIEKPNAIQALEADIKKTGDGAKGRNSVADKVAYTWFNRIIALRFLDANGYTKAGIVSPALGQGIGQPEILADAKRGIFDSGVINDKTAAAVAGLLDGTRSSADPQGEAYSLLLAECCRHWNRSMPFMFEREGDYTELLMPANLLADESILSRAVTTMSPEVCQDVEIIGWLYQFYISERKDEVFAGFKNNKKAGAAEIPAATQLFTPHWIVRYLVENSVGRLWMLSHPESHLIDRMKYYIAPVDEETDFLRLSSPEELTVIDPACGSGHMLTYAFDLLYAIYEEEGYSPSQIPSLILTHNLYGTEIDQRAGALSAFALTMKARAKQRTFFNKTIQPNICVIEPISFSPDELDDLVTKDGDRQAEEAFWNQFEHADTFGSLIRPDTDLTGLLAGHLAMLDVGADLFRADIVSRAQRVIRQAKYLSRQYSVAVANPPYMGSKQMNSLLSQFMKEKYPDGKSDLFAAFIERCSRFMLPCGTAAMITMQSWMFLSSYEKLRASLLANQWITSMLHLGARAFDSIGGEVVSSTAFVLTNVSLDNRGAARTRVGAFIRLVDGTSEAEKSVSLVAALAERTRESDFYFASAENFAAIPGSPIVYWLSEKMRSTFALGEPLSEVANLRQGLATADNSRFLREWWEVSRNRTAFACTSRQEAAASGARWFPYNKGGDFRKWYGNQEYVVNWEHDGQEIRALGTETGGRPRSRAQNVDTYFSPSVSWSDISSGEAAFRRFPAGFIHDVKGMAAFGDVELLDQIEVLMNSSFARALLSAIAPTLNFQVGDVGKVPVTPDIAKLPKNTNSLVETSSEDWDVDETSWSFAANPLVKLFSCNP
ncbi:MAG: BREX-1 system adenine-specific DNA-methyltransferase PglX [Bifidobacterium tibiigranuli]|jgi:hypothetical protein|uniref:BREX-1 system adenine-specific DNA-methyltransferase PglX n=1 Tax=Bifidobacterium tibiigranuli TaxID=2172043 RepID=UPI0023564D16|nr:BREX-1 system adenine-specific DNA-methyltransferase PglX [Bifidobacterium tibiigranuli]MCH4189979.1 BREX-1 system adenine-specific DNA-methyltransferase PglX [Bifidobacterium tibiigranuli]MCH4203890.1 BREX-1 system adenine-specific DNA-methyltransferase PglX [Bifidobacterium tibiigranuli]MCH4274268.1 BREX-1 system adenine-specific DNA-methyltransferase PglX [Bifidobacterium tibiigranuli]